MSSLRRRPPVHSDDAFDSPSSRNFPKADIIRRERAYRRLKSFDMYRINKVGAEFREKTTAGGIISILALVISSILILSETWQYLWTHEVTHVSVDPSTGKRMLINFDVTFPSESCKNLGICAMDVSGEQQMFVGHDIYKIRIDKNGIPVGDRFKHDLYYHHKTANHGKYDNSEKCGDCYGAERPDVKNMCCNTCEDLKEAYEYKNWNFNDVLKKAVQCQLEREHPELLAQTGEGCRIMGSITVNKVAGNIHIAVGKSRAYGSHHLHQFLPSDAVSFNASHFIHSLSFGEGYPGKHDPLNGRVKVLLKEEKSAVFHYYLKLVPTRYDKSRLDTFQYSITDSKKPVMGSNGRIVGLPGIFFVYDFSPFMVTVAEKSSRSFTQYFIRVTALIAGVFTVVGLVDSFVYHGAKALKKD